MSTIPKLTAEDWKELKIRWAKEAFIWEYKEITATIFLEDMVKHPNRRIPHFEKSYCGKDILKFLLVPFNKIPTQVTKDFSVQDAVLSISNLVII